MSQALAMVALLALMPAFAHAQVLRRVEIGSGVSFAGGLGLGSRDASLMSNTATGSPFRLFSSDTRVQSSPGLGLRLGYRLSPRLTIEGTLAMARPRLVSSLANDLENAVATDASSTLTEYVIDGGAQWRFSTSARRRLTPFVSGGAGVARHVHEGRTLIESGVDGYGGGGLLYALGRRTGLRLDGHVHVINGGIAEGQSTSPRGVLSGSVFVAF